MIPGVRTRALEVYYYYYYYYYNRYCRNTEKIIVIFIINSSEFIVDIVISLEPLDSNSTLFGVWDISFITLQGCS